MKSERRHELQTNELADWIGHRLEAYGPQLKTAGAVVLAIAALGLAYVVVSQRQEAAAGHSWDIYFRAMLVRDQEELGASLEKVAKVEGTTLPGLWARQTEADVDLENGSRKLFRDRDEALRDLERAEKNYLEVEKTAAAYPQLLERCRYGLAQAYECQGKLDKAREKYEEVAKAAPNGAIGKMAAKRAKLVGNERIAEFYDWFQRQTPPPPGKPPGLGLPPLDMDSLPDAPNLNFGGDKPADDAKKPADEKPEGDAEKPADKPTDAPSDKPEAKPTDEKPGDKPATEKPATEKPADAKPEEKPEAKPTTEPADKPAEGKPADAKPTEGKPADEKPADAKSAADKPADQP